MAESIGYNPLTDPHLHIICSSSPNQLDWDHYSNLPFLARHWYEVSNSHPVSKAVKRRDLDVCRFCGFQSKKYQIVVAPNARSWDVSSARCACIFCETVLVPHSAAEKKHGVLVYLPELSQAELVMLLRTIYVARISQGPIAEGARATLHHLISRREKAKEIAGTDEPREIEAKYSTLTGSERIEFARPLKGIRLMTLDRRVIRESDLEFNQFPQILAFWRSKAGPLSKYTPPNWAPDMYKGFDQGQFKSFRTSQ